MKVTNTSSVVMHVRGIDGVVPIAPGKTAKIQFTEEQLARARARTFLTIEGIDEQTAPLVEGGLEAKHRGGGSYSIMDGEGKEILAGMSKDDATAFNKMSAEDKAAFVANVG